jgi:sodium-dependent dicarboxylate transporter 2/3/5
VIHNTVADLSDSAKRDFQYALILSVAYASTIGGLATLVGTAPNAIVAAFVLQNYGTQIDFVSWMLVGMPLTALMLPLAWLVLTRVAFRVDFRTSAESRTHLRILKSDLGTMSAAERRVGAVFLLLALTWIFRPLLNRLPGLESLDDSGIAMAGAVALFLIPSGDAKDPQLLRWEQVENLPWGILLLFGGGLSMANSVSETGLAAWIGDSLHLVAALPDAAVVVIVSTIIILLGELTSNVATTVTFLPVVAAIALEAGIDPVILLVPITLAASCSFMLPAGTPPNAIVFGSGLLTIPKMVRAGLAVDIICIVLVPVIALTLVPIFMRG